LKGICLISGGLDSTLAFFKLIESRHEVQPIFVDYGQYPVNKEREAARRVVDLSPKFVQSYHIPSKLVEIKVDLGTRVAAAWGRSVALAGLAAMWAYCSGDDYSFIAMGSRLGDKAPDCKPGDFTSLLDQTVSEATKGRMRYFLPLANTSIENVGRELRLFGLHFSSMYNCYWDPPCGFKSDKDSYLCPGCKRKVEAMKATSTTGSILDHPNCPEFSYHPIDREVEDTPLPEIE